MESSSRTGSIYTIVFHCLQLDLRSVLRGEPQCFPVWFLGYFLCAHRRSPKASSLLLLFSRPVVSNSLWPRGLQHVRPPCPSPDPRVCPNSCSLHWWGHTVISPSDALFSFCPQSFPASGTFPVSHLCASDDQNTGASASALVLPVNIQGWSPLRLTGLISLMSKGLSGIFSSTTVWRHQFFGVLPFLWSSSHTIYDHREDHSLDYTDLCWQSPVSAFQHTV